MSSRYRACPLTDAPFALPESILIATLSGVDRVHSPQFPNSMLARHQKNWSQSGTVLGFLIVRVIALSMLKAFISRSSAYADAREPVMAWYRQVRGLTGRAGRREASHSHREASSRTAARCSISPETIIALWCGQIILVGSSTSGS